MDRQTIVTVGEVQIGRAPECTDAYQVCTFACGHTFRGRARDFHVGDRYHCLECERIRQGLPTFGPETA